MHLTTDDVLVFVSINLAYHYAGSDAASNSRSLDFFQIFYIVSNEHSIILNCKMINAI